MNNTIKNIKYNNIEFKYIINNNDRSGIGCINEIINNDEYKLFKFANKNGIFIDIGGNHGLVTIILAIQNPDATIYVLEPHPDLIEIIKNNIEINNIKNVIVINKALGDGNNVKLHMSNKWSGATSILVEDTNKFSKNYNGYKEIEVKTISFDNLLKKNKINEIELLKIDCEGGEYYLYDSILFKKNCVKNITGEFHNLSYNLQKPNWNTKDLTNYVKKYVLGDINLSYLTI